MINTTFRLTVEAPYGTADLIQSALNRVGKDLAVALADYGVEAPYNIVLDSDKGERVEYREVSTCAG